MIGFRFGTVVEVKWIDANPEIGVIAGKSNGVKNNYRVFFPNRAMGNGIDDCVDCSILTKLDKKVRIE